MTTDFIGGDIGDRSTFSNSAHPNAKSEQTPEPHNCGINDGDCRNACGELPVTSENVDGFLEYLDFNDGSPSGDKMCKALEAVLAVHSPKLLIPMRDGNHVYSCAGCDTHVTFTEFKNCKTRAAIVEVMNR